MNKEEIIMSIALFLVLFTILEIVTPLVVEGLKTTFKGIGFKYNSTVIALVTAVVLSGATGVFTYISKGIDFNTINIFYIVFLFIANWLGATLGYDKVKEILVNLKDETK